MPTHLRFPRSIAGTVAILILLTAVGGPRVSPAEALANCDVADLTLDQEEQAFLKVINDHRAQYGLQPLSVSENLTRSAVWMATDMATANYFSHTDSSGRRAQNRIADCGGSLYSGENLAAGPRIISAPQAFELWRTSPPHNENMLAAGYRQIGIARVNKPGSYYTYYWVTTFDTRDDGSRLGSAAGGPSSSDGGGNLLQPAPGTKIESVAHVFSWNKPLGVFESWLDVGSCWGCNDIYSASSGAGTAAMVLNLPADGRTLNVRLSLRTARGWQFEDYTYTAATQP
jgi:uncharacterized protein YkwD